MGSNREGQPYFHTAGIMLHGCVKKPFHFRERNDLIKLGLDLRLLHPQDSAVEVDVLSSRQLGMKAGANLQQASHTAVDVCRTMRRCRDARQYLEQCTFSRAVRSNNTEHFAMFDFKRYIVERPKRPA